MTGLPNPWITDSEATTSSAPDTAATFTQPPDVAAVPEPAAILDAAQTADGADTLAPSDFLDATNDIHEIFYHARRLIAEDNAVHRRFVLDEALFMEALDEPPLFLRYASWR